MYLTLQRILNVETLIHLEEGQRPDPPPQGPPFLHVHTDPSFASYSIILSAAVIP